MTVSDEVTEKVLNDILGYIKPEIWCETKVLKMIASELLRRRQADRNIVSESSWVDDGYICRFTRSKQSEPPEVPE